MVDDDVLIRFLISLLFVVLQTHLVGYTVGSVSYNITQFSPECITCFRFLAFFSGIRQYHYLAHYPGYWGYHTSTHTHTIITRGKELILN